MPDTERQHTIEADKALMHMNYSNKRMLIALATVCVTFIITILVFVIGYTKREENWLNTLANMNRNPAVTEVANGEQQRPDP